MPTPPPQLPFSSDAPRSLRVLAAPSVWSPSAAPSRCAAAPRSDAPCPPVPSVPSACAGLEAGQWGGGTVARPPSGWNLVIWVHFRQRCAPALQAGKEKGGRVAWGGRWLSHWSLIPRLCWRGRRWWESDVASVVHSPSQTQSQNTAVGCTSPSAILSGGCLSPWRWGPKPAWPPRACAWRATASSVAGSTPPPPAAILAPSPLSPPRPLSPQLLPPPELVGAGPHGGAPPLQ